MGGCGTRSCGVVMVLDGVMVIGCGAEVRRFGDGVGYMCCLCVMDTDSRGRSVGTGVLNELICMT